MKIIFFGTRDINKLGGVGAWMINLCTELVKNDVECVVYCRSEYNLTEYVNGFKVVHRKGYSFMPAFISFPYSDIICTWHAFFHERNVDVVHYNTRFFAPLYAWLFKMKGAKVVFQCHSFGAESPKYKRWQQHLFRVTERLSMMPFSNFITVSDAYLKFMKEKYGKTGIVIPSGINLESCYSNSDAVLEKWNLKDDKFVLFMGRLDPIKNVHIIISAFNKLINPQLKLVIAGAGLSNNEYVTNLYKEAKYNQNIIFTGAVYGEEKNTLLAHCRSLLLVSQAEGSPISLLEAMSFSKTCITSDITSIREILNDSIWVNSGSIEDLSNAIGEVEKNYQKYKHLEAMNYKIVKTSYTWVIIAGRYFNYINGLLRF